MMTTNSEGRRPLVAIVSGVAAAIPPATAALNRVMPNAVKWNLLDDRLVTEAQRAHGVTLNLISRMQRLLAHAEAERADAVLMTCSIYSSLAPGATRELGIPVIGPDDAAFAEIIAKGYTSIHLVSSVRVASEDSVLRASAAFARAGRSVEVVPVLVEGARRDSLAERHDKVGERLADAIRETRRETDAVMLANYSLAPAAQHLANSLGLLAAQNLRQEIATSTRSRIAALG